VFSSIQLNKGFRTQSLKETDRVHPRGERKLQEGYIYTSRVSLKFRNYIACVIEVPELHCVCH
jgi:hypothetical protein